MPTVCCALVGMRTPHRRSWWVVPPDCVRWFVCAPHCEGQEGNPSCTVCVGLYAHPTSEESGLSCLSAMISCAVSLTGYGEAVSPPSRWHWVTEIRYVYPMPESPAHREGPHERLASMNIESAAERRASVSRVPGGEGFLKFGERKRNTINRKWLGKSH